MDPVLSGCTVTVHPETFDVVEARRPDPDALASLQIGAETTIIAETDTYDRDAAIAVESGWRLLSFDVVLPFDLVGFLARVSTALADADVSIFALSAFSTDHVLVKDHDLDAATECLAGLGCRISTPTA